MIQDEAIESSDPGERNPGVDRVASPKHGPFGITGGGELLELSGRELLLLLIVGLLPLGYAPFLLAPNWSLRFVLVVALLPVGAMALIVLVRRRDVPAVLATAFLTTAAISAALSTRPFLSLVGFWGTRTSWLLYLAAFGMWAIGRVVSSRVVALIPVVVVAALVPSVAFGVLQVVLKIDSGPLGTIAGRASGFVANPAYFGMLVSGAASYCVARSADSAPRVWALLSAVFGLGIGLSGARAGALTMLIGIGAAMVLMRNRSAVGGAIAALGGLVTGIVVTSALADNGTVARLADRGGDGRVQVWKYGWQAVAERPLFGWGLGNHAAAIQGRYSAEFVRDYIPSEVTQSWVEPHNLVMQIVVSTGLVGLLFVLAFTFRAVRLADKVPVLLMASVIAMNWALQPASIHSLPLAMLLFGAAARRTDLDLTAPTAGGARSRYSPWTIAGLLGAMLASYVFVIDLRLDRAIGEDPQAVEAAARWFPPDPVIADVVATVYADHAANDRSLSPDVLKWSERTVELQPNRPNFWNRYARRQILLDLVPESLTSIEAALTLEPWNEEALRLMHVYALLTEDADLEASSKATLCRVDVTACSDAGDGP